MIMLLCTAPAVCEPVNEEDAAGDEIAPSAEMEVEAQKVVPSNMDDLKEAVLEVVSEMAKRNNVGVDEKVSSAAEHQVFLWEVKNVTVLPAALHKVAVERQKVQDGQR